MWGWYKLAWRSVRSAVAKTWISFGKRFADPKIRLSYFDEVLAVELHAINERRRRLAGERAARDDPKAARSYEPVRKLQPIERSQVGQSPPKSMDLPQPAQKPAMSVIAAKPNLRRTRPQPIPCTAVGIALSGGGIRSAAFSLGVLQALDYHGVVKRTDYLSTVSGGGYIGACMTVGMSKNGGEFPFGGAMDVRDNDVIGHIRNYSNYLMPSARSGLRNVLDVIAILFRGLLANAIVVLPFILLAALATCAAYPTWGDLFDGSYIPRLVVVLSKLLWFTLEPIWSTSIPTWIVDALSNICNIGGQLAAEAVKLLPSDIIQLANDAFQFLNNTPFSFTMVLAVTAAIILGYWALWRSLSLDDGNDADSPYLTFTRWFIGLTVLSAFLDMQPLLIWSLGKLYQSKASGLTAFLSSPLVVAAVTIALFARRLGIFLETTTISGRTRIRFLRVATKAALILAGTVLPFTLLVIYWHLAAWMIFGGDEVPHFFQVTTARHLALYVLPPLFLVMWLFEANAYSLHQFYKDRLSKAFLFDPNFRSRAEPIGAPDFKLSQMSASHSPYHIINAALNVQGSKEANRRGRNADFFTFTSDFVGSDLTHFAPTSTRASTTDMESVDRKLDLGAAMAISGAALSANMGSNTVRWLSPTLALLNIRLGYWLRNPRDLAKRTKVLHPREWFYNFVGKFYLLLEMFNFLDEDRGFVYLSDGGHIENLGIYQLLKRGCRAIIAVDAEADPDISCSSLLKLERYARIDLGVRIILPWEQIAASNRTATAGINPRTSEQAVRNHGPHCAVGPILYEDGSRGVLLYFKSSLSGDEKDYILDYKKRNLDFPHETTGDQFFTEEQFEVYRALGYHVIEGFFSDTDIFAWQTGPYGWADKDAAKTALLAAIG